MKATFLTSAIALFAFSAAASPQTAQQQPAPAETANVPQQTLSEAAPVQRGDSPLVAAAKRAGRLGKKPSQVITNDTLAKSGGHVTTTKTQEPIASKAVAQTPSEKPAPAVAPVVTAAQKRKAAEEQAKKDTAAAKERAVKRAVADYMGESIEEVNDDPSIQEGVVSQASTPAAAQPPKAARPPAAANKPPTR